MARIVGAVVVGVLAFVAALLAVLSVRDGAFEIVRSAEIAAPPAAVFDQLDDFPSFLAWNPWQDLDPDQTVEVGGPPSGVGAWYTWQGDSNVGRGRMEILAVEPGRLVRYDLRFEEPFVAHNLTEIAVEPAGDGTRVTWRMTGENDLMGKVAGLFLDMDAMVGADFERGFVALEQEAGKAPPAEPAAPADTDAAE